MKVIKDTELINDLKNIDMSVFVGKYIAYQEKIRLNRIQNSKNLKKVPTKVSDFLNKRSGNRIQICSRTIFWRRRRGSNPRAPFET